MVAVPVSESVTLPNKRFPPTTYGFTQVRLIKSEEKEFHSIAKRWTASCRVWLTVYHPSLGYRQHTMRQRYVLWCQCHQLCICEKSWKRWGLPHDLATVRKRRHLSCRHYCGYLTYSKRSGVQAVNDGKWSEIKERVRRTGVERGQLGESLLCWITMRILCDVCALKASPLESGHTFNH